MLQFGRFPSRLWMIAAAFFLTACASNPSPEQPKSDDRSRSQIYLELGVAYLQQGENRKALRKLKEAKSLAGDDARIYNALGLAYQQLGFDDQAEQAFQEALDLNPKNPQVRNNYGVFLAKMGAYKRARRQFEGALEDPLYNNPENAYYNLGWLARREGEPEKAEDMLRTALRLRPTYPPARLALARLLREQGRPSEAGDQVAKLLSRQPEHVQGHLLAAELAMDNGDRDTARKHLNKVAELAPDSPAGQQARRMMEQLGQARGS